MSEYFHVEKPFFDQLATLGCSVTDQGHGLIPSDPAASMRRTFREYFIARGLERITERVRSFSSKVGAKPLQVDVRELGHRWASCSLEGHLALH